MALESVATAPTDVLVEIGRIGLWIQGIGIIILLWLIFQIIILINNRIRRKQLYTIEARLKRIEKKLDLIPKRK